MTTLNLTQETKEWLLEKKIIDIGLNYIKLDNGLCIYLDESEIEHLNSFND